MSEWISVKDRVPPYSHDVGYLVTDGEIIDLCQYVDKFYKWYSIDLEFSCGDPVREGVTHWMELPEIPKPEPTYCCYGMEEAKTDPLKRWTGYLCGTKIHCCPWCGTRLEQE